MTQRVGNAAHGCAIVFGWVFAIIIATFVVVWLVRFFW